MNTSDTQNLYINILQRFKQEYGAEYGIERIGLFGSVARGEHTENSDVDVVVEAPADIFLLIGLRQKLQETFNKPVDLVRKSKYKRKTFMDRIEKEAIYV